MGVAEIEHIGAGRVEKRRAQRIDTLGPADDRRLPAAGKWRQRLQQRLDGVVAAAGQRHGEKIHRRALGLMHDLCRQIVPSQAHDELGQFLGHAWIVQHRIPAKRRLSIDRAAQKCKDGGNQHAR